MNRYNYFNNNWVRNMQTNNFVKPNQSLYSPKEAFEKGNLFADLYSQYKNYKPITLKANTEREKMLLELSQIAFAAHELNLYLDVYPNDSSMIALFNDYRDRANQLEKNYEQKYGPLTVDSENQETNYFAWESGSWPWERDFNV